MFCLETEHLRMELEIARVESLLLHERILQEVAERLILEFRNWTNLENPIIIEKNNLVIDGNHRAFVFKKLKLRYIPVCRIDYFHQNAKLRYWFRRLGRIRALDLCRNIVENFRGEFDRVDNREVLKKILEENCLLWGVQQGDFFAWVKFGEDIVDDAVSAYDMLERVQGELLKTGVRLDYVPCQYAYDEDFCKTLSGEEIIIWTPQITKEMVVDAARKEKIFAPKTTRHLIPARPLNVNVPTMWFKENLSLDEINKRFLHFLEGKEIRRLGPGQVINGRYYEEELFVFYDKRR